MVKLQYLPKKNIKIKIIPIKGEKWVKWRIKRTQKRKKKVPLYFQKSVFSQGLQSLILQVTFLCPLFIVWAYVEVFQFKETLLHKFLLIATVQAGALAQERLGHWILGLLAWIPAGWGPMLDS